MLDAESSGIFAMKKIVQFSVLLALAGCVYSPKPYSLYDVDQMSRSEYEDYQARFDRLEKIDLYTAIAYAIKHNSSQRIQQLEIVVSQREQLLNGFELLPELSANAGYKTLNELNPSTSSSYDPETDTFKPILLNNTAYSVSEDLETTSGAGGITWNALDFGLSYVRAAQGADKMLITQELQRKATHNLVREVINTYFKAYSADLALEKIKDLKKRSRLALQDSAYIEELLISSPMDALFYQKELLDILKVLSEQERALISARVELSVLMGIPLDKRFELIKTHRPLTEVNLDLASMEELTLNLRPELMESRYQSRIAANEVRSSILSAMPTLSFTRNWTYSDSSFLFNESNYDYGANIGFNFVRMFSAPARIKNSRTSKEIEDERRMSLYMAVLSQLHIALSEYAQNYQDYSMARHYEDVANRIYYQTLQGEQAASFGEIETIREEVSLIVASLKKESAYANLQYGIATVLSSIGLDFVPYQLDELSEIEIAESIKYNLSKIMTVYDAEVIFPINSQNPIMTVDLLEYSDADIVEFAVFKFQVDQDTFYLSGPGEVRHKLQLASGDRLPPWISFNPSTMEIIASPGKLNIKSINLELIAENDVMSASDKFTLLFEEIASEPTTILPTEIDTNQDWDTVVENNEALISQILDSSSQVQGTISGEEKNDFLETNSSLAQTSKDLDLPISSEAPLPNYNLAVLENFYGYRMGAFADNKNAFSLMEKISSAGFNSFTQINSFNNDLTNVIVGPFSSLQEIDDAQERILSYLNYSPGKTVSWYDKEISVYYYRVGIFKDPANIYSLQSSFSKARFNSEIIKSQKVFDASELLVGPFLNIEGLHKEQNEISTIANIKKGYIYEFNAGNLPDELSNFAFSAFSYISE